MTHQIPSMTPRAYPRFSSVFLAMLLTFMAGLSTAEAQMARERAAEQPAEEMFWSPSIVILPSTTQLEQGDLDFNIYHAFGPVSSGFNNLFGLDAAANIRFGLDYGVADWVMVGIGRSRFNKVWDARIKARLADVSGWQIGGYYGVALETPEDGRDAVDRLSYHASVLAAGKVSDRLVVHVAPAFTRFVFAPDELDPPSNVLISQNNHYSIGTAVRYELKSTVSLTGEYLMRLGKTTDGTSNVLSAGVDIETGGHVFQMFFTSSQWTTPHHAIAWSRTPPADMDVGWGFNVHRVFGTGR